MKPVLVNYLTIPDFGTHDVRLRDLGWHVATIGTTHRDADTVTHSNHRTLVKILSEIDPDEEFHGLMHCGHWAVGWMDHIVVDPKHSPLVAKLQKCAKALEEYPILSEDDHSALECELHDSGNCGEYCSLCESED
jgi:hypothetical protein